MVSIDKIIAETINEYKTNYLASSHMLDEDKKKKSKSKKKHTSDKKKKNTKNKNKSSKMTKEIEIGRSRGSGAKNSDQRILTMLKGGGINRSEIARDLYPDLTPAGAQSEFNKKINGFVNPDSGHVYSLGDEEFKRIRRKMSNLKLI